MSCALIHSTRFRSVLLACIAMILSPAVSLSAAAGEGAKADDVHDAVTKGLAWLAAQQGKGDAKTHKGAFENNVAMTAFAGLSFLASGSQPDRGEYAAQIKDALNYVLASQKESGLFASDNTQGPMYGHGYATVFVAEAYMKTPDPFLKPNLEKAVALIERTANKEGGWRYLPQPVDADISVTACELNALLAARAAGIKVDEKVIEHAIQYIHKCQNEDGGFSYMAGQGGVGGSGVPRSAAAVAVLIHGGAKPVDRDIQRGIAYLSKTMGGRGGNSDVHYYYGRYYASQWPDSAADDPKANEQMTAELLKARQPDGSWKGDFGLTYATANALIILQAPERKLWIFGGAK